MEENTTAIYIKTEVWEDIMFRLKAAGWKIHYEYDAFDQGIDIDLIILQKDNERIYFGWTNWFEGEIFGSDASIEMIEKMVGMTFTRGSSAGPLREEVLRGFDKN